MYKAEKLKSIEHLRELMEKVNELNFCLFSTSGIHGSYVKIEGLFIPNGEGGIIDEITVLVIRPRLVSMFYGTIKVQPSDVEYLKELRQLSWDAVGRIGKDLIN